jgi:HD-GYP domain-containing protein (c-di-GMP phosphodiesterase class II)
MLLTSAPLDAASSEQVVVFFDITERKRAEEAVLQGSERLERILKSVVALIGKVVETRDPYTQGHEEGVARIGRLIAEELGLPEDEVEGIEVAGLVHDVGKLSVPAEILTKPGKLADVEYSLIKEHSRRGYDILKDIDFDWPVAGIVLQHHERMDGSGYPAGLAGDDISIAARILMVADVIEAMGAHRPYRPALGLDAAMAEITGHPEKYDEQVVSACVRLHAAGRIEV